MSELPRPVTTDQEYLAAILGELRGISAKLDVVIAQTQHDELEPCIAISEPAPVPSGERVQAAGKIAVNELPALKDDPQVGSSDKAGARPRRSRKV